MEVWLDKMGQECVCVCVCVCLRCVCDGCVDITGEWVSAEGNGEGCGVCADVYFSFFPPGLVVTGGREETDFKRCVFNQK